MQLRTSNFNFFYLLFPYLLFLKHLSFPRWSGIADRVYVNDPMPIVCVLESVLRFVDLLPYVFLTFIQWLTPTPV